MDDPDDLEEFDSYYADKLYGGDVSKLNEAVSWHNRNALNWSDVEQAATVYPELERNVHDVILDLLGYLPPLSVRIRYEPAIRTLGKRFLQGELSEDDLSWEVAHKVKLMRNFDMRFSRSLELTDEEIQLYHQTWLPYGQAVKDRLTRFLGYVPDIKHSFIAEMWLRDVLAKDTFQLANAPTEIDFKAINNLKYREVLVSEGKIAANNSPLVAMDIRAAYLNTNNNLLT